MKLSEQNRVKSKMQRKRQYHEDTFRHHVRAEYQRWNRLVVELERVLEIAHYKLTSARQNRTALLDRIRYGTEVHEK